MIALVMLFISIYGGNARHVKVNVVAILVRQDVEYVNTFGFRNRLHCKHEQDGRLDKGKLLIVYLTSQQCEVLKARLPRMQKIGMQVINFMFPLSCDSTLAAFR